MRRTISRISLYLFLFVLAASLFAQQEVKFKSLNDIIPNDPNTRVGTLKNGIRYYIRYNKKPENRLELRMAVKAGSVLEDEKQKGLAHFCEHMAFNGTKNFPKNDLVKFLESIGMRFGADINAYTSFDETVYMLQLPTDDVDKLKRGFQVLDDWSHNVSYEGDDIDKERGVIMEEWRLGKGAFDRIQKKQLPVILYKSHYADRLPIGDTSIIQYAPYDDLRRFYHDWYRPDLMTIVAVGDYDIDKLEAMINEHYGDLENPKNEKKREKYNIPMHKEALVSIATDKELPFTFAQLYFKYPGRDNKTFNSYRQGIVEGLFTGMLNNRLEELTRKADPPFTNAGINDGEFLGGVRALMMFVMLKDESIMPGTEALLTEAYRVMKHGFTQTELDRRKKEMLRRMETMFNEKDKTESENYAGEYIRNFTDEEPFPGIEYELGMYKKFLPEITLEEVNSLAKARIKKDGAVVTISAPEKPSVKLPTEPEVLALFDNIAKKDLAAYEDKVSDSPLFTENVVPGKVVNEEEIPELGVTEWTLSNGVKIVMKPTDFKNDEIQFRSFSPGGSSQVADADYMSASSADNLVDEAGISEFDLNALQKMLQGKIVRVNPGIGQLIEGISGSSTPEDVETMFQLVHLYFTQPRKDDEAFKSYMNKMKSDLKNQGLMPEYTFYDSVSVIMSQRHFRARPMTEQTLDEINYDKAFEIYKDRFADASDFTFFFVGNFDLEKFQPLVEKYLGSLPSSNRKEMWKDDGMRYPTGKITKNVYKGVEEKSSVRLVFSGNFDWTPLNRYYLQSMISLLNIKLRESVREDKGGTYGIYSRATPMQYPNKDYRLDIGWGCAPDRVDELIASAKEVIEKVKASPEDVDLQKVKEIQKREYETNLKENWFWLSNLYSYSFNNEDPRLILEYPKWIEKLTIDDIKKAAKTYLNDANLVQFVLYPENKK